MFLSEKEQYFTALNEGKEATHVLLTETPFTSRIIHETVRMCNSHISFRYSLDDIVFSGATVVPKGKPKSMKGVERGERG
jgi:cytochrome P450